VERVMGLDPATRNTGWAVLYDNGKIIASGIVVSKKTTPEERIYEIGKEVMSIVAKWEPDRIYIEAPDDQGIVGRTTGTQALLAAVTYFIAGTLQARGFKYELVKVQSWKGSVKKAVIARRLAEIYGKALPRGRGDKWWEHDAIDAVGLARWGLYGHPTRVSQST